MPAWTPAYPTLRELLSADSRGEVTIETLDDLLWYFLTGTDGPHDNPAGHPAPVVHYFASKLMEFEVGNGGFAQAAYNIPEWFDMAADGYDAIGAPACAGRVRQAKNLVEQENKRFSRGPDATIGQVFSEFAESELGKFDEGLDEIGWWDVDKKRIAYVRAHRDAFMTSSDR